MSALTLIFWCSGLLLVYAYIGYPVVLWLLSIVSRKSQPTAETFYEPTVTMLISAYNEKSVIDDKLRNTLALEYPRHLLEIIVVSDGSTDGTDEIVSGYADRGVLLKRYDGRIGKTACLNNVVPLAKGEIIVFSDANSQYDREVIRHLVQTLADRHIGFTSGITKYRSNADSVGSISLYSKLEILTKQLESRLGSCIGADGAIFAIRKNLFRPLKNSDINDFVLPLSINERGLIGKLAVGAVCVESTAGSMKGEFNRQVRISARTIRAIINFSHLLNPLRYGFVSFELFSHKLCKLLGPFLLVLLLASSLSLSTESPLYGMALTVQALFYFMAVSALLRIRMPGYSKYAQMAHTFVIVNCAMLIGWIQYIRGKTYMSWSPSQRERHRLG